ncbi:MULTISPECIES: DctP family TRAP transporter solute-binding subunit [Pelosinus]|uniref:TRAP dicarboxylate transporter, DctP subunit n=1 Tax=Pelosinus fermentans B4 TaxID=1149862 RepID=I8RAJ5_9FIRM|nr:MULTISPECIES: DctP family TRAP transporter solute-binding subunit [Pelosinus]EIW15928.1 TRAP dicarboxylate transporter, DctP subunit [Pelosinus fermentans B4]EIW27366.1 methyl-accepting chemotaxis sensory transducer [Pelosinus fermentans A11]
MKEKYMKLFFVLPPILVLVLLMYIILSGFDVYSIFLTIGVLLSCSFNSILLHRIMRPLKTVSEQASRMKDGDLTVSLECGGNNELGEITTSINSALEYLRTLLSLVTDEAAEVSSKSVEIASVSDGASRDIRLISMAVAELASGAQETGTMAQNAASKTDQVSELAKNTAAGLQSLLQITQQIMASVHQGSEAIGRSKNIVNEIAATAQYNVRLGGELKGKSQEVREIIKLINSITAQTNLLALNAAIEAARAGEHGRGFAVVAEEVRELANRSHHAAGQINEIVESMLSDIGHVVVAFETTQESMNTGVNTITAANVSFADIRSDIEKSRIKLQEVTLLADNQADAAADLMSTVHGVAAIAEQSAAATQTAAASSEQITTSVAQIASGTQQLSRLAGNLEQAVFRFHFSNTKTLRVGFEMTDKSVCYAGMERFGQILHERTQGRYSLKIFHSAQLGTGLDMIEKLKEGTLEMTFPALPTLAGLDKRFMVFDFPFLIRNESIADYILHGPFARKLLDMLDQYGFYGLTFAESGFRNTTNSRHAIMGLEDFRGLKIRTMQNDLHIDTWKALGADPIPLPFANLYNAMRLKEVDGQENPIATIYDDKFYEVQKFLTLTNHVYSPFILMYSKKLWDIVPAEDKPIIEQAAKEGALYTTEVNWKRKKDNLQALERKGMFVGQISSMEMVRIQEMVKPVIDRYKNQIGKELVNELFAEIKKAEEKTVYKS